MGIPAIERQQLASVMDSAWLARTTFERSVRGLEEDPLLRINAGSFRWRYGEEGSIKSCKITGQKVPAPAVHLRATIRSAIPPLR